MLLTLAAPFILRPTDTSLSEDPDGRVIIVTPHNETIRREFGAAFTSHMKARTGKTVRVDWRTPGAGTSEIAKYINSEFTASFENYWKRTQNYKWEPEFAAHFNNRKLEPPAEGEAKTKAHQVRDLFLNSTVGIGIDLFFGGGTYDFEKQKRLGYLVASSPDGSAGLAAVSAKHKDWFSDSVIPQTVGGEPYYDPELCWAGACLSSFGICYNTDLVEALNAPHPPMQWEDLTDPVYFDNVAMADPNQSGSVTKAFEMLIQQQIQAAVAQTQATAEYNALPGDEQTVELGEAISRGWLAALRIIQNIGANSRYFTDSATKIPHDVAQGEAAAGMCVDFYGRTYNERLRSEDGTSRVQFIVPKGGTSTGVDPIGMFRGAPNPEYATAFLEFVLSPEGQRLWNYKAGAKGGPGRTALRRLPVRKDLYTEAHLAHFSDPEELPYEKAGEFTYIPNYTAPFFDVIRFLVKAMCIDVHPELKAAREALIQNDFPPRAVKTYHDLRMITYEKATSRIHEVMRADDKLLRLRLGRDLAGHFRKQYQKVRQMAERGE